MEMFLLAAISRGGLNTLYALQRRAGLQPGNLAPVIRKLTGAGLMTRSGGAKRGRRAMELTEVGDRLLIDEWKKERFDEHREVESIFRSVTVALWMDDVPTAADILFRSAAARGRHQAPQEQGRISGMAPTDLHLEMRTAYENQRRAMEAFVLQKFGENMVATTMKRRTDSPPGNRQTAGIG